MNRDFLETALAIGAEICRDAIWWEDRCNWLGDELDRSFGQGDKLATRSLGPTVYSGTIGVAMFLARLGRRTGEPWFEQTAAAAARQAIRSTREEAIPTHSFHSGRFGVAFGLIEIGAVLNNEGFAAHGRKMLSSIAADQSTPEGLDVIAGSAGALLGLGDLARRHNVEPASDYCQHLAGHLKDTARESDRGISWKNIAHHAGPDLNGYAHGVSGNIAALQVANRTLQDPALKDLIAGGLRYERSWFAENRGNWPDLRKVEELPSPDEQKFMTAWCHGAPGIGLARLQLANFDDLVLDEARAAFDTTARNIQDNIDSPGGNYSLCHGLAGNADILISGSQALNDATLLRLAETVGQHGQENYGGNRPAWPNGFKWPGYTPSLMMGLAGAGYFYLRLDDPPDTPSILGPGLYVSVDK